jgi:peptide/nickel transport system permease protein
VLLFVVRRLAWAGVLAFVISLVTFVLFFMIPNDAATLRVGRGSLARSLQSQFDLQGSPPQQYAQFLEHIFTADFGRSTRTRENASRLVGKALPVTASLVIGGTVMWLMIAFPIGILSALRPRSLLDKGTMVFVLIGVSAHPVWLSLMLSYFFGAKLGLFPVGDYCSFFASGQERCGGAVDWAYHMVLPWFAFALLFAALYARMLRASVIETLDEDYVKVAYAKGAPASRVLRGHVLRNAMLPIVSMLGMDVGIAFGGALFIESAFGLPGIGQLLYQSTLSRDLPVLMGIMLVVSVAIAFATVIADVAVSLLDPRVGLRTGPSEPSAALLRKQRAQVPTSVTSPTA